MKAEPKNSLEPAVTGEALTPRKAASLLWNTAWEALILAFLIQALGSVAVAMLGNIWERMLPSLPPVLASEPKGETAGSSVAFHFTNVERFSLIFAVVFLAMTIGRLMKHSRNAKHQAAAALWERLVNHNWFHLLVINALIAFALAPALQAVEQFAPLKVLWAYLVGFLQPCIDWVIGLLPTALLNTLKALGSWYGDNQLRFTFWLLYSAAICDDLGLPNYKTLGRKLWKRLTTKRKSPAMAATAGELTNEKLS